MKKIFRKLLLLVFVCMLCCCKFSDGKHPSIKNLHEIVILDQSLTRAEVVSAINAMHDWECASNGNIQFMIIVYPTAQELANITDVERSVIIINVSIHDRRIINSDASMPPGLHTVALYSKYHSEMPEIIIAKEYTHGDHEYQLYLEHELGHSLGLRHLGEDWWPTKPIMYMNPGISDGITDEDLAALSDVYQIDLGPSNSCQ